MAILQAQPAPWENDVSRGLLRFYWFRFSDFAVPAALSLSCGAIVSEWIKGKSGPTFGPVGPFLVTADEVPDPQNLTVSTKVNGKVMQHSNTSDMIFSVRSIIATLSRYMDLRVGDLVITGTPEGVGMGMKPPRYLQPGDVVEVEVEGLGLQRATVS